MTVREQIAGLCAAAAALSLAVAAPALAAPAGDEYLPKVPQSGAHSSGGTSSGSGAVGTTTLPTGGTSSPSVSGSSTSSGSGGGKTKPESKPAQDAAPKLAPLGSASSGASGDGDSSDSILFNPIVLLVIAAVIAAAIGMTLRRRRPDEAAPDSDGKPAKRHEPGVARHTGPRTPEGEIVTGRDRTA